MKKKRIIPVILLKNGWIVQSKGFSRFQNLGNPSAAVTRFSEWMADELIYVDITRDGEYDLRRDDIATPNRVFIDDILKDVSKETFMPVTFGGKIKSLSDIERKLQIGADKIAVNTHFYEDKLFARSAAKEFGSQCIVASIDYKVIDGKRKAFSHFGSNNTEIDLIDWMKHLQEEGVGEFFLNSIDRDGMKCGFDCEFYELLDKEIKVPIIACGGAGDWEHFEDVLKCPKVDAVAAANIFQHVDQSLVLLRKYLFERGCNVRPPLTFNIKEFK